eukprot:GSMAST32.ASY1.ANO1.2534.1 assembled CDS
MMKLITLLIAINLSAVSAVCPNQCSNNGSCGESSKCTCYPGYTGADCSLRECSFGLSWTAEGTGVVPAGNGLGGLHPYTECSSKGICNRDSGECECFEGYTGQGCRRQQCPDDCSGHGRCVKLVKDESTYSADGTAQFSTQFWDSQKTRVCECNRGYEGYNCNLRICPKGDDPITDCDSNTSGDHTNAAAHNMVQRLWVATTDEVGTCSDPQHTTKATYECSTSGGTWTEVVNGFYLKGELANDNQKQGTLLQYTADRIRDALQDLPNFAIPKVNVTNYIDSHSGIPWGNAFDITFTDSSTSGKQNLLECVYQGHECNGSQPKMSSWAVSVEKGIWEVVETGKTLEENASCGNRGLCDTSTGICQCFEGHTGENCGTQTIFF